MQLRGTVGGEYSESLSNIVNTVFLLQMVQDKPTQEESRHAAPLFFLFLLDVDSESLFLETSNCFYIYSWKSWVFLILLQ